MEIADADHREPERSVPCRPSERLAADCGDVELTTVRRPGARLHRGQPGLVPVPLPGLPDGGREAGRAPDRRPARRLRRRAVDLEPAGRALRGPRSARRSATTTSSTSTSCSPPTATAWFAELAGHGRAADQRLDAVADRGLVRSTYVDGPGCPLWIAPRARRSPSASRALAFAVAAPAAAARRPLAAVDDRRLLGDEAAAVRDDADAVLRRARARRVRAAGGVERAARPTGNLARRVQPRRRPRSWSSSCWRSSCSGRSGCPTRREQIGRCMGRDPQALERVPAGDEDRLRRRDRGRGARSARGAAARRRRRRSSRPRWRRATAAARRPGHADGRARPAADRAAAGGGHPPKRPLRSRPGDRRPMPGRGDPGDDDRRPPTCRRRCPTTTGRMPLMEHLTELRNRLIKCVIAVGARRHASASSLYDRIFDFLIEPYQDALRRERRPARSRAARSCRPTRSRASRCA